MTQATPAATARSKCGRYTSRSVRSSTRTSTVFRDSSMLLRAKCFTQAMTLWRCTPRMAATAISPSR